MLSLTKSVLRAPYTVSVGGETQDLSELWDGWKKREVYHCSQAGILLHAVAQTQKSEPAAFSLHCLSSRDLGFENVADRRPLQAVFNAALQRGFHLGTPRILYNLSLRRTPVVQLSRVCLVAMASLEGADGQLYLPVFQARSVSRNKEVSVIRMSAGDPYAVLGLDIPILFVKPI